MDDQPTCGQGLAHNAAVPAALAAVAAGLAQNLEVHIGTLDVSDAAAAQEQGVYERVANSLRSAAAELEAAAARMASAVDLPMGGHDMAGVAMGDVLGAFEAYVSAGNDLRRLLDERHDDDEQMLATIREAVDVSPDRRDG